MSERRKKKEIKTPPLEQGEVKDKNSPVVDAKHTLFLSLKSSRNNNEVGKGEKQLWCS